MRRPGGLPRKPESGKTSGESSPSNSEYSTTLPPSQETSLIPTKSSGTCTPTRLRSGIDQSSSYVTPHGDSKAWQDNSSACGVCKERFRKRDLSRRHHCRVCGLCVCAGCSPNKVVVDGFRGPQRVCNPCVRLASGPRDRQLRDQAVQLALRLRELQDPASFVSGIDREPADIEEALQLAESALQPIAASHERAVGALRDAGERLASLAADGSEPAARPEASCLEDATEYLARAIDPAEARLRHAESELALELGRRAALEARVLRAEAAAKLHRGERSNWRSQQASAEASGAAQEGGAASSFAPSDWPEGGEGGTCATDKCTTDKCALGACVVL